MSTEGGECRQREGDCRQRSSQKQFRESIVMTSLVVVVDRYFRSLAGSEGRHSDQSLVRHRRPSGCAAACRMTGTSISNSSPGCRLDAGGVAQHRRAEEIGVQVAGPAEHRVAEVVVLEIGDRMRHVRLAGEEILPPRAPCRRAGCGSCRARPSGSSPISSSGPSEQAAQLGMGEIEVVLAPPSHGRRIRCRAHSRCARGGRPARLR